MRAVHRYSAVSPVYKNIARLNDWLTDETNIQKGFRNCYRFAAQRPSIAATEPARLTVVVAPASTRLHEAKGASGM